MEMIQMVEFLVIKPKYLFQQAKFKYCKKSKYRSKSKDWRRD